MFQILQRVCSRAIKENLYEEILVYNVTRIMRNGFGDLSFRRICAV